jgi:hypothetical protein
MHASHSTGAADALAEAGMNAIAFRVLAHEIRGPSAVISGYARMFREGRLTGNDLSDAVQRIEQAAARLSQFGRQASDLAKWLGEPPAPAQPISVSALVERAIPLSGVTSERLSQSLEANTETMRLNCLDVEALAKAVGACLAAVAREAGDGPIALVARAALDSTACDILAGPANAQAWRKDVSESDLAGEDPGMDRGGMGLAFILAAAVTLAHGGRMWSAGGRQGLVCLRLPVARG